MRAKNLFSQTFGGQPDGVWSAPGRANLIGEHTDYNLGLALPFAVGARTWVAARSNTGKEVRLISAESNGEIVRWVLQSNPPKNLGWASYAAGVLWLMQQTDSPGLDIGIASDLPIGAGVSSSAALECAIAIAARDLWKTGHTDDELATFGSRAENEVVGAQTGKMDQLASIFARQGLAILIDFYSNKMTFVPLDLRKSDLGLFLVDSGQRHNLATDGYGSLREGCEEAARIMGGQSLGEIDKKTIQKYLSARGPHHELVRHVVEENERVRRAVCALRFGQYSKLGKILTESHNSLRDNMKVSTSLIDEIVKISLESGALGARIVGGGFGGSVLVLIPTALSKSLDQALNSTAEGARPTQLRAYPISAESGASKHG